MAPKFRASPDTGSPPASERRTPVYEHFQKLFGRLVARAILDAPELIVGDLPYLTPEAAEAVKDSNDRHLARRRP